jgi:serine/threonine-protein kinase HipA
LGFQAEQYTGEAIKTFFANLLPEGVPLEEILSAIHMRNASAFEIVGQLGAELPGVLSVLPEGEIPSAIQQYSTLSKEELSQRIRDRDQSKPLLISNSQSSMSLPGAQDKLGLRYDDLRGLLYDSVGSSPTTHIAKPDTRLEKYQPSAINEYLCMKLAAAVKLPVPPVSLIKVPQSLYIVQRYDRVVVGDNIVCLHQVDACQILGLGSDWKYERQAGLVSLKKIAAALRALQLSAKDMLNFQRWVMFNYLIGNSDAHAKNISVLIDQTGYRLAPFYDLLCVQVYGDDRLALFIGDDERYESIGAHSWEAFCEDCGFSFKPTLSLFRKLAQDLPKAWEKVTKKAVTQHDLSKSEKMLVSDITEVIKKNCSAALSMSAGNH